MRNLTHWKIHKFKYLKPHIYIYIYSFISKNWLDDVLFFQTEGPASDNILVLSADMENLTGLGQQAVNTEHDMFKYS